MRESHPSQQHWVVDRAAGRGCGQTHGGDLPRLTGAGSGNPAKLTRYGLGHVLVCAVATCLRGTSLRSSPLRTKAGFARLGVI